MWVRKTVISSVSNWHSMTLDHNLSFSRKVLESNLCLILTEESYVLCIRPMPGLVYKTTNVLPLPRIGHRDAKNSDEVSLFASPNLAFS